MQILLGFPAYIHLSADRSGTFGQEQMHDLLLPKGRSTSAKTWILVTGRVGKHVGKK